MYVKDERIGMAFERFDEGRRVALRARQ
jgi:hypothetical protein